MKDSIYSVRFPQLERTVEVRTGAKLLDAAAKAGVVFGQLCGGTGICKRCTMKIIEGQTNERTVLACLTPVESNLAIQLPEELLSTNKKEITTQIHPVDPAPIKGPLNPLTRKIFLSLTPPTLTDNRADVERLQDIITKHLGLETIDIDLDVLKTLPSLLRSNDWSVTATVAMNRHSARILTIEGGDTTQAQAMVAVDIGTTSIAAQLLDPSTGAILSSTILDNSQSIYGSDVTSRVIATEKHGTHRLRDSVVNDLNTAISSMCQVTGIKKEHIHTLVCSGNTVMCHFLLGLDTANIRRAPYIAVTTAPNPLEAATTGIEIHPKGQLYCLPGIGSWVGGDITAGIYESGLHSEEGISLLMDIGTNGEIVIGNKEWLMACSASAGPALEGSGVECGMQASNGAIERVDIENGTLTYKTISDTKPKGICGSGIIDLTAALLKTGIIDRGGKFTESGKHNHILVPASETANGRDIAVSEGDIENIINAKAALYAAMRILLKRLALGFSSIHHFFIAGAFGGYINVEHAVTIGLLPDLPPETFHFAGNTSLAGARGAALDRNVADTLRTLSETTTYYDLMGAEDYVEEFRKALFLPHTDINEFHQHNKKRTS